jgi:molybdopterin synthase sulfur carrier subunit
MIRIRFFARFGELFGPEIQTETEQGTTLRQLIQQVSRGYPEGQDAVFTKDGEFRRHVILMRNGARIDTDQAAGIIVRDGDEIAIFPPVAGG